MSYGTPVNRSWVSTLMDGTVVIDWGNGQATDILKGEIIPFEETNYSHPITEQQLDMLVRAGTVGGFDNQNIYFKVLTELQHKLLD